MSMKDEEVITAVYDAAVDYIYSVVPSKRIDDLDVSVELDDKEITIDIQSHHRPGRGRRPDDRRRGRPGRLREGRCADGKKINFLSLFVPGRQRGAGHLRTRGRDRQRRPCLPLLTEPARTPIATICPTFIYTAPAAGRRTSLPSGDRPAPGPRPIPGPGNCPRASSRCTARAPCPSPRRRPAAAG